MGAWLLLSPKSKGRDGKNLYKNMKILLFDREKIDNNLILQKKVSSNAAMIYNAIFSNKKKSVLCWQWKDILHKGFCPLIPPSGENENAFPKES